MVRQSDNAKMVHSLACVNNYTQKNATANKCNYGKIIVYKGADVLALFCSIRITGGWHPHAALELLYVDYYTLPGGNCLHCHPSGSRCLRHAAYACHYFLVRLGDSIRAASTAFCPCSVQLLRLSVSDYKRHSMSPLLTASGYYCSGAQYCVPCSHCRTLTASGCYCSGAQDGVPCCHCRTFS